MKSVLKAIFLASLVTASVNGTFSVLPSPVSAATPDGFADLTERLSPAVVNISSSSTLKSSSPLEEMLNPQIPPQLKDLFRDFLENQGDRNPLQQEKKVSSLGSGFIIDAKGIIVTNSHVIKDADDVEVILNDGRKLKAEVLGTDIKSDIAVLKVKSDKPLPYVSFADSASSRVGDWVIAIGNPFGVGQSVTAGIISARNRNINATPYDDFIQTDAAINRGNSGGPLFNMAGEVIGVNSAILSPSGGSVGIGFSIPSNTTKHVVTQLLNKGHVERGWLGVAIQGVTPDIAESLGLKDITDTALIASVSENGPAAKAGLEKGDIILLVNGQPVTAIHSLPKLIADLPVGNDAELTILRKGQQIKKIVKVGLLKDDEQQISSVAGKISGEDGAIKLSALGITGHGINEKVRRMYNLSDDVNGVVVTEIERRGSGDSAGLRRGDLIVEAQQVAIKSSKELQDILEKVQESGRRSVLLGIVRGSSFYYVTVPVQGKE